MKKTIIFASVALATLFAFSSCQKENLENNYSENNVRVITATFESNGTKTTLGDDIVTPLWSLDDKILILNASGCEPPITLTMGNIKNNGRTITFTTSLSGTLYAVYPASATTMTSCNGSIDFTIPAIQDGKFGSANICVAKGDSDENNNVNLVFRNATAVLEIKTAEDVVGVDVTAANNIAGTVTASFEDTALSLTTTSLDKNYVSAVGTTAPTDKVFYLAVAPVEATGDTKVNCYKTDLKGSEDKTSKELKRNVIYSMDLSSVDINDPDITGQRGILNGHEYVIIKAKYDGEYDSYLKWATMNIGATAVKGPDSYGRYFMWGETTGIVPQEGSFVFPDTKYYDAADNFTWKGEKGFAPENCPWTNDSYDELNNKKVFTKYVSAEKVEYWNGTDSADDKTILDAEDDAASALWDSTWRTPTGGENSEFEALKKATYWVRNDTDGGYYVFAPNPTADADKVNNGTGTYDESKALLFFPFAGYGYGSESNPNSPYKLDSEGRYWSSRLNTTYPSGACCLSLDDLNVSPTAGEGRYSGLPIRPVSD